MKEQLIERRNRLVSAIDESGGTERLTHLLHEVDSALERVERGTFGTCEVCSEPIETERLRADPLARYCLDHLTSTQQRMLERDLEAASRVQRALLPQQDLRRAGWEIHYRYQPHGPVSCDYVDVAIAHGDGDLFFVVADVSGKGVAASILMAHLHAMFQTLVNMGFGVAQLVERTNQVFCESTMSSHYATMACGRAAPTGEIDLCNAGHCTPLVLGHGGVRRLKATALPVGLFCHGPYATERIALGAGESLVLYTDGLTEASLPSGADYGLERLCRVLHEHRQQPSGDLAASCLEDLDRFLGSAQRSDDLTLVVVRRASAARGDAQGSA